MTPRREHVKLKRLHRQLKRMEGNPVKYRKIALRIQTIENTDGKGKR